MLLIVLSARGPSERFTSKKPAADTIGGLVATWKTAVLTYEPMIGLIVLKIPI